MTNTHCSVQLLNISFYRGEFSYLLGSRWTNGACQTYKMDSTRNWTPGIKFPGLESSIQVKIWWTCCFELLVWTWLIGYLNCCLANERLPGPTKLVKRMKTNSNGLFRTDEQKKTMFLLMFSSRSRIWCLSTSKMDSMQSLCPTL